MLEVSSGTRLLFGQKDDRRMTHTAPITAPARALRGPRSPPWLLETENPER